MDVQRLRRDHKSDAVAALAEAFYDYPVMRFVLKTEGKEYDTQLQAIMQFYCESRFAKEGHVLGIGGNGSLVAVALVDEVVQKPWPERDANLKLLRDKIGEEAYLRLEMYEDISSRGEPQAPHFFLGMIGVRPQHQGRGFAGQILETIRQTSTLDRRSTGVCLSTENPYNVPFYQRFGYHIIAEADIGELHSWCMFLPTLPHRSTR